MLLPVNDELTINSFDEFFENELYQLQHGSNSDESLKHAGGDLRDSFEHKSDQSLQSLRHPSSPHTYRDELWPSLRASDITMGKRQGFRDGNLLVAPLIISNENHESKHNTVGSDMELQIYTGVPLPNGANDWSASNVPPVDRERTLSPALAYAYLSPTESSTHYDTWQQDFRAINLQGAQANTFSTSVDQERPNSRFVNNMTLPYRNKAQTRYHYPFQPAINSTTFEKPDTLTSTAFSSHDSISIPQYTAGWSMQTSYSLDGSQNSSRSYGSRGSSTEMGNSTSRPNLRSWKSTGNFGRNQSNPSFAAWPSHGIDVSDQHYDHHQNGLGIHYPPPEEIGCAISYPSLTIEAHRPQSRTYNAFTTYPTLPPAPVGTSFDLYNTRHKSLSYSPSPPLSPTYQTVSSAEYTSPSRPSRSRRKSIQKAGPRKDTPSNLSSPTHGRSRARSQTQHRSRSQSAHTRTRSVSSKPTRSQNHSSLTGSATTPTSTPFDFDFVNYTPKDSAKLMSDVAPSGSSRTRARREQEARERRKKANEVALTAVRNAGGDVRDLQQRLAS